MATARSAALVAPSTATVATGIPVGIWTVARRASMPSREAFMGTPITGSSDLAAITPARCAAFPAPAMITEKPLIGGRCGELERLVRGLVGGEHPDLAGDPERIEGLSGLLHHRAIGPRAHDDCDFVTHEGATVARGTATANLRFCSPYPGRTTSALAASHTFHNLAIIEHMFAMEPSNHHFSGRASRFQTRVSSVWSVSISTLSPGSTTHRASWSATPGCTTC